MGVGMQTLPRRVAFLLLALSLASAATDAAERCPNFLFILGDNVGQDWFGCYGSDEKCTPNVDKLAATGVRFEHCYVTPLCSTTRAALLTGRYGFRTGWHTHHDAAIYGGGGFDWRRETTWARLLQAAGYKSAIAGKWQINDLSVDTDALAGSGFDEHLVWTGALLGEGNAHERWQKFLKAGKKHELESRYWDPVVYRNRRQMTLPGRFGPDTYADFLIDFIERHRDQPFVAYYATPLVHIPTVPTPLSPQADAPEREQFAGMVRYLDYQVGRLIAELERLGLRDNTIVIFTTDNGSPKRLGGMVRGQRAPGGLGGLTEGGLDVPLIVNCPARLPESRVIQTLVDCTDFLPTVLELAGVELPRDREIDGRSFALQLTSDARPPKSREWIFSQNAETRVVRDRRFKLYSTGAFYDLTADPLEKNDLAINSDATIVAARARLQMVLNQLPPDSHLPFAPRSSSAFQLEAARQKLKAKTKPD
jgi:arylsulfatase A-like enzyme